MTKMMKKKMRTTTMITMGRTTQARLDLIGRTQARVSTTAARCSSVRYKAMVAVQLGSQAGSLVSAMICDTCCTTFTNLLRFLG